MFEDERATRRWSCRSGRSTRASSTSARRTSTRRCCSRTCVTACRVTVAFEPVTVKAYVDQVVLVHKGQVVAKHRRSRTAGEQVLEPMHFLAVLERKPAYLDHTKLFKELKLPAAFGATARAAGEGTGRAHRHAPLHPRAAIARPPQRRAGGGGDRGESAPPGPAGRVHRAEAAMPRQATLSYWSRQPSPRAPRSMHLK